VSKLPLRRLAADIDWVVVALHLLLALENFKWDDHDFPITSFAKHLQGAQLEPPSNKSSEPDQ